MTSVPYLLCLMDTGHVLFGQAGAVESLLWIFLVALEHLGLQLSAQIFSMLESRNTQREGKAQICLPTSPPPPTRTRDQGCKCYYVNSR